MVQWKDGDPGGGLPETICHSVQTERSRFGGGQFRHPEGALWTPRGLEVLESPKALYEEQSDTSFVGVAGDYEPSERPGAGWVDRVRFRHQSASTCGGLLATGRGWSARRGVCLDLKIVKTLFRA